MWVKPWKSWKSPSVLKSHLVGVKWLGLSISKMGGPQIGHLTHMEDLPQAVTMPNCTSTKQLMKTVQPS